MHRSRSWVTRVRGLLDAPAAVQQAIENGEISWHEWATDRDAILTVAESAGENANGADLRAAYKASKGAAAVTSTGASAVADREPSVSLPLSTAQAILRTFQKFAGQHNIEIEAPKKPTRKQLAELLDNYNRKIGRIL